MGFFCQEQRLVRCALIKTGQDLSKEWKLNGERHSEEDTPIERAAAPSAHMTHAAHLSTTVAMRKRGSCPDGIG